MKSGASQTFNFNQCLAEKQEKYKKGIPILWSPTSTVTKSYGGGPNVTKQYEI